MWKPHAYDGKQKENSTLLGNYTFVYGMQEIVYYYKEKQPHGASWKPT